MKKFFPSFLAVFVVILFNSIFITNEAQQAIVTQFGKPVGEPIVNAGLKFKIPFIQKVIMFDKRILEWDGAANEIPTKDDKYIFIDTFARWRISDPLTFFKAAKNERNAQSRLDDVIDGIVRDEISNRNMEEIIRSSGRSMETYEDEPTTVNAGARSQIIQNILDNVTLKLADLKMGIEVLDVQLKRIDYNKQVQSKLFNRMISEQNMIAEEYRGQGQGRKQTRLGEQIRDEKKILSEAYMKSQKIRGDADAYAIKRYSEAYEQRDSKGKINKDAVEFYEFLKTLDAYENVFDSSSRIILSTDSEFFKYLK
ncbi:MAG: HflC protein [Candidatus Marinimicrobia bacterium]|nr:HflC protein [Candidatus Neomarinimicrobiota bacterium]|tara:strand:- start:59 stop:991 length:933 start_codon:yes stop_codon:yes gene_type:complete